MTRWLPLRSFRFQDAHRYGYGLLFDEGIGRNYTRMASLASRSIAGLRPKMQGASYRGRGRLLPWRNVGLGRISRGIELNSLAERLNSLRFICDRADSRKSDNAEECGDCLV